MKSKIIISEQEKQLIPAAFNMLKYSYSPYSNFKVGAALLSSTGKIFGGCNIENSSFGATVCAERIAIFKAVSEGEKSFSAICIVGGKNGDVQDFFFAVFYFHSNKLNFFQNKEKYYHFLYYVQPGSVLWRKGKNYSYS